MVIGTSTMGAPISNVVESMAQHLRSVLQMNCQGRTGFHLDCEVT
jgi:hypothetical protein